VINEKFLKLFSDLIFVEHKEQKADIIMIPGSGYPQMAEKAAELYKRGCAPFVLPSGKYGKLLGKFEGVMDKKEKYSGTYETEWEFLADVLKKNGVPGEAVLREDKATYTYENALCSARAVKERNLTVRKGIVCCKAFHARRCQLYYQLAFPEAEIVICPADTGINRRNWYQTEDGIRLVLGEVERCGGQFHDIMNEIRKKYVLGVSKKEEL
jgi:uncharacterized SAM-binding protein YcdF (DUF218 family)